MKTIRDILKQRGYKTVAELLRNSYYKINATSSYGSALHSLISTAEIFSPIDANEKLLALSEKSKKAILEAFMTVYPPRDNSEEVRYIDFSVDAELNGIFQKIIAKKISELNNEFVNEQIEKCNEKISQGDFSGAITNARTMIETICIFIIETQGGEIEKHGDLPKLFRQVSHVLKMDPSKYVEDSLKQIIQGCASIVSGIASLRNSVSDAHGHSIKRCYKPSKRHAELVVNISLAVSEFFIQSFNKNKS